MSASDLKLLERKLMREINAREQAEKLLEEKSLALYESNTQLKEVNGKLKTILEEKSNTLFRRELEYKSLVENINDIICKTDLLGTISYVNPIVETILGYEGHEVVGKTLFDFLPNHFKNKGKLFYEKQITQKNCLSYVEIPALTKEDEVVWLGVNIQFYTENCPGCDKKKCILKNNQSLSSNKDCHFKEVIIVARDITEQKNTQKLLARQTYFLEQNIKEQELTSEIALELNTLKPFENRINNVIEKVGKHARVSRVYIFEDLDGGALTSNTFEWIQVGVRPEKENLQNVDYQNFPSWKKLLKAHGRIYAENITSLPRDLQPILNQLSVKSIIVYPLTIKNKPIGFIGFVDTVTIRKWTKTHIELLRTISGMVSATFEREYMENSIKEERDKANKANNAKSEFLANVSHEIRTPMNAILGFSEALSLKLEKPKDREMIKSVVKSGQLLLSLLNDILDFSKLEAGKIELNYSAINLINTIEETVQLFMANADKKKIYLHFKFPDHIPQSIIIDEHRIKQVCFNLIANAIKFTHEGGVLVKANFVKSSANKGTVIIKVRDTGIGISPSQTKVIFESFRQQYGQADRQYGGTGLGLTISQKLIENMGGAITVKSKVGIGSEFTVTIPNVETSDEVLTKNNDNQQLPKLNDFELAIILIVDDTLDNTKILKEFLPKKNIRVQSVSNGAEAQRICQQHKFDLMFIDIKLPDINGTELALKIRKLQPKSKIVAYTASEVNIGGLSCHHTFDSYLPKPLDRKRLIRILNKLLKSRDAKADVSLKLDAAMKKQLPTIVEHLETVFLPQWEKNNGYLILYEIKLFAMQLQDYAHSVNVPILSNYAAKLNEFIELIDLDNINRQMQKFPEIIEELKANT